MNNKVMKGRGKQKLEIQTILTIYNTHTMYVG